MTTDGHVTDELRHQNAEWFGQDISAVLHAVSPVCMIRTRLVIRAPAWRAAPTQVPRSRVSSRVTADSKGLARAVKAVKVKVITVSKGNSKGTEVVAGDTTSIVAVILHSFTHATHCNR